MELQQKIKDYITELVMGNYKDDKLQLNSLCKKLNLEYLEVDFNDSTISGMILHKKETYTIYVNHQHSTTRKRFTTAHEIGHYISALCGSYSAKKLYNEGFKDHSIAFRKHNQMPFDEAEIEANEIAAQMLMPEAKVKEFIESKLSVEEMANKFFVSPVAMTVRVERLLYESGIYLL